MIYTFVEICLVQAKAPVILMFMSAVMPKKDKKAFRFVVGNESFVTVEMCSINLRRTHKHYVNGLGNTTMCVQIDCPFNSKHSTTALSEECWRKRKAFTGNCYLKNLKDFLFLIGWVRKSNSQLSNN